MSSDKTYCFIINCASNANASEGLFRRHEKRIKDEIPTSVFKYIRAGDSIQDFIREHITNFTHFVACGGDGTVNQVANALAGTNKIMGVIPLGSGNDFAKNIGLTGRFEHDLSVLLGDNQKVIDAVQTGNDMFVNTYGIGVDGLTNYYASRSKFRSGFLKYFFSGFKALLRAKRFDADLTLENETQIALRSIWMVAIANGKTEGGRYKISPASDNGDGMVEIVVVKGVSRFLLILEFIKLSVGIPFKENVIEMYHFNRSLTCKCLREVRAHSDGEQMGKQREYHFKVLKQAVRVVIK